VFRAKKAKKKNVKNVGFGVDIEFWLWFDADFGEILVQKDFICIWKFKLYYKRLTNLYSNRNSKESSIKGCP